MPRRSVVLVAAVVAAFLIPGSSEADVTAAQVNADCKACDDQVSIAMAKFQSKFGTYAKAIDGAKYHCGVFSKLKSCFTDCLHGTNLVFNSQWKASLERLYSEACDPECSIAVLPWCYQNIGKDYDVANSCNGSAVNSDLKACFEAELFVKQNCTGVCTVGQRKAAFFMFAVASQCSISFNTAYSCYDSTTYCSEYEFGSSGSAFVAYSNQAFIGSNQLACSAYGDHYSACMQQAVNGVVVLGSVPEYATTYQSPCAGLATEVQYLQDYARTKFAGQMCNAPQQSFSDMCQAYSTSPATTTSTVRPISAAGAASPTTATITARQAIVTNAESLSPTATTANAPPAMSSADRAVSTAVPAYARNRVVGSSDTGRLLAYLANTNFKPTNASAIGSAAAATAVALCFAVLGILSSIIEA